MSFFAQLFLPDTRIFGHHRKVRLGLVLMVIAHPSAHRSRISLYDLNLILQMMFFFVFIIVTILACNDDQTNLQMLIPPREGKGILQHIDPGSLRHMAQSDENKKGVSYLEQTVTQLIPANTHDINDRIIYIFAQEVKHRCYIFSQHKCGK